MKINEKGYPIPENIAELLILSFANKDNRKIFLVIGKLESGTTALIKQEVGLDLTAFKLVLDSFAIIHVFKSHSKPIKEMSKGNTPILFDDFAAMKEILDNPDSVSDGGKTKQGLDTILFEKAFSDSNEIYYCIQEVRMKRKELYLKTMYKKRKPPNESGG